MISSALANLLTPSSHCFRAIAFFPSAISVSACSFVGAESVEVLSAFSAGAAVDTAVADADAEAALLVMGSENLSADMAVPTVPSGFWRGRSTVFGV